jgi:hypothetical protein
MMEQPILTTPTAARGASKEGVVRYILLISTTLVVFGFVIAYIWS